MNDAVARLEETLDYVGEHSPHSRTLLDAFKAVMMERNRLTTDLKLKPADSSAIDRVRLNGGIPVIRQCALFFPDDPGKEIALTLIPPLKEGLPALRDDLETLRGHLNEDDLSANDYLLSLPDGGDAIAARWSERFHVPTETVILLMNQVARVILEERAQGVVAALKDCEWNKGYCCVCGALPAVSMIQEQGHQRWLHCADCGYEWRFSRVICPFCGHEDTEGKTFFFVENRPREMVFMCSKCDRYLISINRVDDITAYDLEIRAMGLVHLDIIAQEKGLTPMKACIWNTFA